MEEGASRKRKLNVFDFLKGDTETLPTTYHEEPVDVNASKKTRRDGYLPDDYDDYALPPQNDPKVASSPIEHFNHNNEQRNYVGFTLDTPMSFTKASTTSLPSSIGEESPPSPPNTTTPKLSYSEVEALSNKNTTRMGHNLFSGKKYGLGATLLQKMGWVQGKGLGVNLQGRLEPIDLGTHRQGAGIGADLEKKKSREKRLKSGKLDPDDLSEEESSDDEEYYKEVPKKSLFQIIVEIESLGVVKVPESIKRLSDEHSSEAKKSFIELRKEGGNVQIEQVTSQIDRLNNELSDLVASIKMAEFEQQQLEHRLKRDQARIDLYTALKERLDTIDTILQSPVTQLEKLQLIVQEIQSQIAFYTSVTETLPEYDILKTLILATTPLITTIFAEWDPLDITDTTLLDTLTHLKTALPSFPEIYGELGPFQSLVYTLWEPKVTQALSTWSITQPNLAITLLLDWEAVLDPAVVEHFIRMRILPRIVTAIREWDVKEDLEDPPYVWVFEWLPYLRDAEDIELEFAVKFEKIFMEWDIRDGEVNGVKSYREIVGDEKFKKGIEGKLLPRLVGLLMNVEWGFNGVVDPTIATIWSLWFNHLDDGMRGRFVKNAIMNSWLRALYHTLSHASKARASYSSVADAVSQWSQILLDTIPSHDLLVKEQLSLGLDMINKLIDTGVLAPVHQSLTKSQAVDMIISKEDLTSSESIISPRGIPVHRLHVSFKDVVEDYCTEHNLFLSSLSSDFSTGRSLFRVSRDANGKGGTVGYISEDVLFIKLAADHFEPISLEDLDARV
ncbi:CYFA0S06e00540g1_1 [Cyberlindnera fabianii]|uniref:CYFA0S06e00540g1_1 n=1 Tax=Cyberlindnera fabianii TaxID=36022 RepID=A0A061AV49_CYBFA|nr:CYFA0S06e00540g1_1 [Cyberlindnera fabianii]